MKFYKEISARSKFHEQNLFHEEKNQLAISFTYKNQYKAGCIKKTNSIYNEFHKQSQFHVEKNNV